MSRSRRPSHISPEASARKISVHEASEGLDDRSGAMASSLAAALRRVGHSEVAVDSVVRAYALAMEPRLAKLDDDHHPAYLHPGRSALILLQDVGSVDVAVLTVAVLHESADAWLRLPEQRVRQEMGDVTVNVLATIPGPGDEALVERLVTLGAGVGLAVLAERLDHIRHLHMRNDLAESWVDAYEEVLGAWLPFAQRTHPRLATRYAHWARTFVKRL